MLPHWTMHALWLGTELGLGCLLRTTTSITRSLSEGCTLCRVSLNNLTFLQTKMIVQRASKHMSRLLHDLETNTIEYFERQPAPDGSPPDPLTAAAALRFADMYNSAMG
jgi:hypothetical protein